MKILPTHPGMFQMARNRENDSEANSFPQGHHSLTQT